MLTHGPHGTWDYSPWKFPYKLSVCDSFPETDLVFLFDPFSSGGTQSCCIHSRDSTARVNSCKDMCGVVRNVTYTGYTPPPSVIV